jgi:hypothetical protein
MVITHEQRIFVVKRYFLNESYALCQEAFQEAFPNDTVPNKTTIYRIITKFVETGSVCDRKHNHRRTVLNDDTLKDVRLSFCFLFFSYNNIMKCNFGFVLKLTSCITCKHTIKWY